MKKKKTGQGVEKGSDGQHTEMKRNGEGGREKSKLLNFVPTPLPFKKKDSIDTTKQRPFFNNHYANLRARRSKQ